MISEDLLEFSDNLIDCDDESDLHQSVTETCNDGQSNNNTSTVADNLRKISIESKSPGRGVASTVQETTEADPTPPNSDRSEDWSKIDPLATTVRISTARIPPLQSVVSNYTSQTDHAHMEGISCKPETTAQCEEPLVHIDSSDDFHSTARKKTYLTNEKTSSHRTSDLSRQSDHVSCEDLLEFACDGPNTRRTRGPRNGEQSDEVRIMLKVLHGQSTPESCIAALNVTEWDVLAAIKVERLQGLLKKDNSFVGLEDCKVILNQCGGDVVRAAALLRSTEDTAAV